MKLITHGRTVAAPRRLAGFSLVELMVSLALGLMIISGMLTLLSRNSETRAEIEKAGRQVENGRYAVQRLSDDLHQAGFYGAYYDLPAGTSLPDPCSTDVTVMKAAMSFPVQASVAAATPPSCIDAADFIANTNVLVVRFVSTVETVARNWPAAGASSAHALMTSGVAYLQPYVEAAILGVKGGTAAATNALFSGALYGPTPAPIYRYVTRLYFLSPCSRPAGAHCASTDDAGVPVPTLKMVELISSGGSPAFSTPIAIAEGIERIEYDYGLDSNGDGSPDSYVNCSTCSVADWSNVVAVRINLLARNGERTFGYSDTKSYAMGLAGSASAPSSALNYKRHVFQVLARVSNVSMRREK